MRACIVCMDDPIVSFALQLRECVGSSCLDSVATGPSIPQPMRALDLISQRINAAAAGYKMERFQELRRRIHGLKRTKLSTIFPPKAVKPDYTFHSGGRAEIQFNMGFEEDDWLRYGLAFSLEPSRSFADPLELRPKIERFNEYVTKNGGQFGALHFWYWDGKSKSRAVPVQPIPPELVREPYFLFIGRIAPRTTVTAQEILHCFDSLLPLYEHVEGSGTLKSVVRNRRSGFVFIPGFAERVSSTVSTITGGSRYVDLRHNRLQKAVHGALCAEHGKSNVGIENDTGRGSRVDVVVKVGRSHHYYEIKTAPCVKSCLRDALSQLLEYSYWPEGNNAEKLVVVSENDLTPDAKRYIRLLRRRFRLPLFYRRIDVATASLSAFQ